MNIKNNISNCVCSYLKTRICPDGLLFFNRDTGINILIDEIKPPVDLWSSAPHQVSIALTNNCDLECSHCYAPKNSATLKFEKLIKWLHELDQNGCIGVGFGGGEPTIYPRLIELCSYVTHNTKLAVTMTTHAHRLTDRLLNELAGNIHFIRVSMDGIGATYESIRHRSFDLLIDHISKLRLITKFGINFLVNSKTINDIEAAIQLATDLKASELLLLPEEPVGRGIGIDQKTMIDLQKWINKYHGKIPLTISENNVEGIPICNPLSSETGLNAFAHIDANGTIIVTPIV